MSVMIQDSCCCSASPELIHLAVLGRSSITTMETNKTPLFRNVNLVLSTSRSQSRPFNLDKTNSYHHSSWKPSPAYTPTSTSTSTVVPTPPPCDYITHFSPSQEIVTALVSGTEVICGGAVGVEWVELIVCR
jgi:hypothetical protein